MAKADKEVIFTAIMDLVEVNNVRARYRVVGHDGINIINLHHLEVDRKELPRDDDFNMDFIKSNLDKAARPQVFKVGKSEDDVKAEEHIIDKAHKKLVKKQKDYKDLTQFEIVIRKMSQ